LDIRARQHLDLQQQWVGVAMVYEMASGTAPKNARTRMRSEAIDQVKAGDRFRFRAAVAPLNSVQIPAKAKGGRSSPSANQTTSFFVSGFGSGAYSAKLFGRHQAAALRLQLASAVTTYS
jgi:hypothetical protein